MIKLQPLPISAFLETILNGQIALQSSIKRPRVDRLALLLLSRPIHDNEESLVLNFFSAFWIFTARDNFIGFFSSEEEAIWFARNCEDDSADY